MAKDKSIKNVTKGEKPKITVITPTYNRANFIKETIESILNQTFKDFEYYILDDGSTDNTKEIVKPYLKDNRVKYLYHDNVGEAETVNWGWSLANGEYFTQVNSDDPILSELFFEMVKVLDERKDVVVAYPNFYFIDDKGIVVDKTKSAEWNFLYLLSLYSCECANPGTFIRKVVFKNWGKIKNNRYHYISDTDMYWSMALEGNFFHVDKYLANWRTHLDGISSSRYKCIPEVINWFNDYFNKPNLPNNVLKCKDRVEIAIYSYFVELLKKSGDNDKRKKINYYKRLIFYKRFINMINSKIEKKSYSPLVSVIIPVYNGENFVKNAILSVFAQTYKNIEIIVVNDGSNDNSDKIIRSFGKSIRYFKKKNGGVSTALNLGIKKAKGKYVSWLSHDDEYYPEKIEKQIEFIKNNRFCENEILFSNYHVLDLINKSNHVEIMHSGESCTFSKKSILKTLFISGLHGCTLLIPKECFEKVGYFDTKLKTTQDYDLWFKFIDYGYKFHYLNETLISTRHHSKQGATVKKKLNNIEIEKLYTKAFGMFYMDIVSLSNNEFFEFIRCIERKGLKKLSESMIIKRKKYFEFSNLQVGDNDLIGNKFNGHDLHKYLRENNIDSYHLVWNKDSDDENTFQIAGEKSDREVIKKYAVDIQRKYCLDSTNNPIVYDILYNELFLNADIVHFHLIHNDIFDIQLLPIISHLKPIVWTVHDPWPTSGHCIQNFDCEKWKVGCGDCPYLSNPFFFEKDNTALNYIIKRNAIQNSKINVIVASKYMKDRLNSSDMFKNAKINVIPFGIDHDIFKPIDKRKIRDKLGIPVDAFVISFRGDNNYKKGLDYIEYTIKNIKSYREIYFLVFGGEFANKNKKYKFIEYGWIKNDLLMADIYNASDLFLMPSIVESFGMMAIEAMSCGVLPIVLNGTALPNTVNAPECGVSVPKDKEKYKKTVQYFIDHDDERKLRAKKCLDFARKNYKKDIYVKKIIKVYKEAIKNHLLSKENKFLLKQLKEYMVIEPTNCCLEKEVVFSENCVVPDISFLHKYVPEKVKRKVKDLILITFYKVDKLFPKKVRLFVKIRVIKYPFIRKYLIKNN